MILILMNLGSFTGMKNDFDNFYYLYYSESSIFKNEYFNSLKEALEFIKNKKDISICSFKYLSVASFDVDFLKGLIHYEE